MELLIQSNASTLTQVEIEALEGKLTAELRAEALTQLTKEVEEDSKKWVAQIRNTKTQKLQRDVKDRQEDRVYRWRKGRTFSQVKSSSRSVTSSMSSGLSLEDIREPQSSMDSGRGGGRNQRSGRGKHNPKRKNTPPQTYKKKLRNELEVINLSTHSLTPAQIEVLSLGLTFSPTNSFDYFTAVKDLYLFARKIILTKFHKKRDGEVRMDDQLEQEALNALEELLREQSPEISEAIIKQKLASPTNINLTTTDIYVPTQYPFTDINPKCFLDAGGNLSDTDIYTESPSIHIKEESASVEDGNVTDTYADNNPLCASTHIKEESTSCAEGNVTDTDTYTEQTNYSSTDQAADTIDDTFEYQNYYPNNVNLHKNDSVQEEPPFIICSECGECFSTDSMLVLHQRVHGGRKIHSCPEYGMSFSNSMYLSSDLKTHAMKEFACSECGKLFATNEDCVQHENTHTVRRPYICNVCGRYFSNNSNRIRHQKIHTDEKPFSCNECGKSFRRKTHLTIHRRVHTGEKPFNCLECGKCFSCSAHLTAHRRIHRKGAVFLA